MIIDGSKKLVWPGDYVEATMRGKDDVL